MVLLSVAVAEPELYSPPPVVAVLSATVQSFNVSVPLSLLPL